MLNRLIQTFEEYKNRPYFEQFHDMRALGLLVFLLVALLISYSGVKSIQTNYDLQKRISELKQQNQVQQLANANQKLKNQYLASDQYLDIAARQNFGLGAPGEKLILVPEAVARKNTVAPAVEKRPTPTSEQPFYQRNFQAWMNFFLNRPGSGE
jgi:cell division protein FtsB